MKIVVIGAGIVGLCAAWALTKRGHHVTIVEQGPIPNPGSASFDQHRMIRPQYGAQAGYTSMIPEAFYAWDALWKDLGRSHFLATGVLAVDLGDTEWMENSSRVLIETRTRHRRLSSAEIERAAPMLRLTKSAWGLLAPHAGLLLAGRILADLALWLEAKDVELRAGVTAEEIYGDSASVRLETGELLKADRIIVAAGAWVQRLVPALARCVAPVRSTVAYVEPPSAMTAPWERAPALFLAGPEAHLYAIPPVGGTGLKFGGAVQYREAPMRYSKARAGDAMDTLRSFRPHLLDGGAYRLQYGTGGYYADTKDKRFLVADCGKTLVISGCGGRMFKFAALIGRHSADWACGTPGRRFPGCFAFLDPQDIAMSTKAFHV